MLFVGINKISTAVSGSGAGSPIRAFPRLGEKPVRMRLLRQRILMAHRVGLINEEKEP